MMTALFVAPDEEWALLGECRNADPDGFFVQGADQQKVKALCVPCRVRTQCLADALDNRIEFGIWGGMTERERRALLRRHPDVSSWRKVLETAQANYESSTGTDG